jgi:hypothetical protein
MADALLKSGEIVQIPIEEMEEYLYANADKIQPRKVKRRGPVRKAVATENSSGV